MAVADLELETRLCGFDCAIPRPPVGSPAADVTGAELGRGVHVYIFIWVSKIKDILSRSVEHK